MGCSGSKDEKIAPMEKVDIPFKDDKNQTDSNLTSDTYKLIINDLCPKTRLDASSDITSIEMKGKRFHYTLEYCYVSQRGYYPQCK